MSKKELVKAEQNMVVEMASMFEADAGSGLAMGQEDLALPFLKIVSALDPILDDEESGARKGDIINTVTGSIYKGKEGIRVVPCAYQRKFIQWSPRGVGSGAPVEIFDSGDVLPKTQRSTDDNRDYLTDGSGMYLEETHQHFVLLIGDDGSVETALIAFKSTQLKKSRKWNSMCLSRSVQGANGPFTPPRFSHIYRLKTVSEENSKGSWHGWEMSVEGLIQDPFLYQRAKEFSLSIEAGEVKVKHTEEDVEPKIVKRVQATAKKEVAEDEMPF